MKYDKDIMDDAELEAIRIRCDSATSGPWQSFIEGRDHLGGSSVITTGGDDIEAARISAADQDSSLMLVRTSRDCSPRLNA
jgi:hypothetical protein